ncbi:MAG: hypothetical protein HYW90_03505 [Candidatus Sungbacteria bacterium]|nr:hypothetical protein [Candidatus Sungbacteria bacterium]
MRTQTRIQKLEREVAALWQVVKYERLWDLSVVREIRRRSKTARRDFAQKRLRTENDVFARLFRK